MGAYNYKLAKFLTSMLDPVISKDHSAKDSFLLCKEIKKKSSTSKFLISCMCILFTSIPLYERNDLVVQLIFDNNPYIKIIQKDLKKLLDIVTSGIHILFNGNEMKLLQ